MEIVKEKDFNYNERQYIAYLYKIENKTQVYGKIVYANTGDVVENAKGLVREMLKPYGIEISTNANVINTHQAIKKLIEILDKQGK